MSSEARSALTADTRVVAGPDHAHRNLGGEAVVLDVARGLYYGLSGVGPRVWDLLQQPVTVESLCATIRDEHDVGDAPLEADMHALLNKLIDAQLVELVES